MLRRVETEETENWNGNRKAETENGKLKTECFIGCEGDMPHERFNFYRIEHSNKAKFLLGRKVS